MSEQKKRTSIFIVFIVVSILVFVFSQSKLVAQVSGGLQGFVLPIMRSSFSFFHREDKSELAKLKDENRDLKAKLVKMRELERDNKALRDQFALTSPPTISLLPASIVAMPSFFSDTSFVDGITIDRGSKDGVGKGDAVVFKDNLVGRVVKVGVYLSVVDLLNHKGISFTAQTSGTSALGIVRGNGGETMLFDNVLQSDSLKKDDIVVTKDSQQLIVGKIISINKKASSLFQSAEVVSLVDIRNLQMVFVYTDKKI